MTASYRLLHVEDSPDDAELVRLSLRGAPFRWQMERVETEADYVAELEARLPDAIICDYDLPRFSAARALNILGERGLEIPFILVSHHIGEGEAVVAMQQGASDYLPKRDMARLTKALEMAIDRTHARAEKARAVLELSRSEAEKRAILNSLGARVAMLDGEGVVVAGNKAWDTFAAERSANGVPSASRGTNYLQVLEASATDGNPSAQAGLEELRAVIAGQRGYASMSYQLQVGGITRWYLARALPLEGGRPGAVVSHEDITDTMMSHIALEDAHKRLQALSLRVLGIQEEERRAISRELHDDVGQTLGALKIGLHRMARCAPGEHAALLDECISTASVALERLSNLSHELHPPQLDQLGLEEALRWLGERQMAATGIEVRCKFGASEGRRRAAVLESACYRIAQECLNNAARHAQAKAVTIGLEGEGELLKLSIHDDGIGFDEAAARQRAVATGSLGLISMEERARLAGGRLKVRTVRGGGTTVTAIFPLRTAA